MTHQYMPKIFHGPHKNPPSPPPYILNVRSVINIYLENSFYIDINKNIISYFNTWKLLFVILLPMSCKKENEASLISYTFWETIRGQVVARVRDG